MDRFPSSKPFTCISTWSQKALATALVLVAVFALNSVAQADTYWSDTAPASVTDLMTADYWTNGAPTTSDNPGFITGKTVGVSTNFDPGAEGQDIDLTFNGNTSVSISGRFVPLANLASNKAGTVTFRLTDKANVNVSGNFWGGINDGNRTYSGINLYQYYGGNSTFSSNEWWAGMTTKTYISISDNAVVTAGGGSASGLGWDDAAYGSQLEMSGNGKLNISSTNLNFYGNDTTVNMHDNSVMTTKTLNIANGTANVNLYDSSKLTASAATTIANTASLTANDNSVLSLYSLKLDNTASLTLNGNAKMTVTNECPLDRNGAMYVNDNAEITFTNPKSNTWKIGDVNAGADGGAIYTQTGGTVNTARTTYFSYHADATITISGGKFISTASQLYATDQKGKNANITLSGDGYLQAKDFRLSQHGNTNLTMSGTSQIKVENLNMAFNHTANDNVVNVVTMGGSSNITASSNMYFFGSNAAGAAYGSLTLNDNASIAITNDVQVGKGSTISLITGKSYAAEITLNDNSVFTAKTFTAKSGAKSATSVNGSATFNADTITIEGDSLFNVNGGTVNALTLTNTGTSVTTVSGTGTLNATTINTETGTTFNVNGGEVNVTSLNNAGTVNLAGGAINLTPYGLIDSTTGTFNTTSGAVNITVPTGVTYSAGDQMIVGYFADDATATAVLGQTVVPENWQKSVISMGDTQKAVVASYGDTVPTGVKTWIPGTSGSMTDSANWSGDASNPTGYVLDGTNAISGIIGKTVIMGGTNTLSGATPAGATIAIGGGNTTYNTLTVNGSLIVNDGTLTTSSGNFTLGDTSGAVFNQTGGKVTAAGTTYFSYHADATVNLSGGQFISNGNQLYVTDNKQSTANIKMSGDSYLQAKDLRLSQHGKTNLTMSDDSHLSVTALNMAYNYGNGDNVESVILISGNSKIETSGSFVTFGGNKEKKHNGAAYASFTMKDNANVYVSGNTWGGSDATSDNKIYGPGLISGKNYNLEMTFTDNSYFSTNEFWMAMTAKAYVIIDKNATVIARGGYSGLGWNAKAAGSKLEIKGGTFQVDSTWFAIGCGNDSSNNNTGVCNVVQTGGNATYKRILLGQNASSYEISGEKSVVTAGNITTQAGSTFKMNDGTVTAATITDAGTLDVSGGTLNAGGIAINANGAIQISGGTIIPGASGITAAGAHTVNLSGGVFTTNGASWTATDITATVADNSTVTFEPEAGQTIKWTGALVNNAQNAKIVKNGNGFLKIDSSENNPTKLESFVVNAGELDFKGYFTGSITVGEDAVFSPGNSIGTTYETGTFTLDPGATLLMEIGTDASGNVVSDQLIVDGDIVIGENAMILLTLDPDSSLAPNTSFTVDLISGTAATDETYQAVSNAISSYYFTGINVDYDQTNKVIKLSATLDANAVPEPSTWALLALGAAGLLYWRKRTALIKK